MKTLIRYTTEHASAMLLAFICGLFIARYISTPNQAAAQTDSATSKEFPLPLPTTTETKTTDYIVTDREVYKYLLAIANGVAENGGKIDLLLERTDAVQAAMPDPRPNINTIAEDDLALMLDRAGVRGPQSKATLIWNWIHDGGGEIKSIEDLDRIPGIGEKTYIPLWPMIKTADE